MSCKVCRIIVALVLLNLSYESVARDPETSRTIQVVDFDIAEQSASDGLRNFAQQTGLALIFPQELVASEITNRLKGHFSIDEGLRRLLSQTKLVGQVHNGSTILISV